MEQLLLQSLEMESLAPALPADIANALAETVIGPLAEINVYPRSITAANHCLYFLGRRDTQKYAGIISTEAHRAGVLGNTPIRPPEGYGPSPGPGGSGHANIRRVSRSVIVFETAGNRIRPICRLRGSPGAGNAGAYPGCAQSRSSPDFSPAVGAGKRAHGPHAGRCHGGCGLGCF